MPIVVTLRSAYSAMDHSSSGRSSAEHRAEFGPSELPTRRFTTRILRRSDSELARAMMMASSLLFSPMLTVPEQLSDSAWSDAWLRRSEDGRGGEEGGGTGRNRGE